MACRAEIGITLDLQVATPDGDSDENRRAAELGDGYTNRWFLDPLFRGRYPSDVEALFDDRGAGLGDALEPGDLAAIAAPLDFLGMNFYMRRWYRAVPDGLGFTERLAGDGDDTTEMGWGIAPDAMGEQLARLRADYPPIPIYITENGMADREGVGADGAVHDARRIDYLRRHFAVAEEAARGRHRPARVLRVELHGQLRMGPRVPAAVRDRPRRLRDAGADPQGQRALVRRRDPDQRGGSRLNSHVGAGGHLRPGHPRHASNKAEQS